MEDKKPTKDETYWKVLNCAVELEIKKGHLKWTMTELSRKSKVTRSLIYYYFGRSKMAILEAAVQIIGEEFVGLSEERMKMWDQGLLEQSLVEARSFHDKAPHLCSYYVNFRDKPNEIGKGMLKLERTFIEKLKKFAPKAQPEQINAMFAVYYGMVYAPNVGRKEITVFISIMQDLLRKMQ